MVRDDGLNELTCVPTGEWVMLTPQSLPPIFLDKSLFSNTTEIKISPQKDGSIIISAVNSTDVSNLNATYSMN